MRPAQRSPLTYGTFTGAHTVMCVCNRLLYYSKCTGFTVEFKTRNPSKSLKKTTFEAKGRQYTTGKVIKRLLNIDLYTYLAIYRYR